MECWQDLYRRGLGLPDKLVVCVYIYIVIDGGHCFEYKHFFGADNSAWFQSFKNPFVPTSICFWGIRFCLVACYLPNINQ